MAPRLARGLILEATHRTVRGRPVVHLFGRLEEGETFLVRDGRGAPYVYLRERDLARAEPVLEASRIRRLVPAGETDRRTLAGEPVVRLELVRPSDTPPLRDRLLAAGVVTYEADVRYALRFLIDRGIRGGLEIAGRYARGREGPGQAGVDRVYDDPELSPLPSGARLDVPLTVLSIDLETDPGGERIFAAALVGCGASEVLLVRAPEAPVPEPPEGGSVVSFGTEAELLDAVARRVRTLDPDVLTGWNVIDFDLAVLVAAAERLGRRLDLGREPGAVRLRRSGRGGGRSGPSAATVAGRVVLDGLQLVRGSHLRMESYGLDAVARAILGEGKITLGLDGGAGAGEDDEVGLEGIEKAREIERLWREDPSVLARYNLADARLVVEILERLQLVELAVKRSLLVGLPPDRMAASVAAFDFLYLSELGRRRRVAPTVGAVEATGEGTYGGAVFEPTPGFHEQVAVFDFKSLYPSLIRTFGIDPLLHAPEVQGLSVGRHGDLLVAPNGAAFRQGDGILPALLDRLFPLRQAARERGDQVAAYAIKILMNSFYGVLGTRASRFHDPAVANAVTSFGRTVLGEARRRAEAAGFEVLYGDTDSLFVATGAGDPDAARRRARELGARLDEELAGWVEAIWEVPSRLELELERILSRLLLPAARDGSGGARKRYAGRVVEEDGTERTVFVGMEAVRRDWTDLARELQRELYERLFTDRPVVPYLRQVLAELRSGALDDRLVYRKRLRKHPREYTSTTPPHVAAARKLLDQRRAAGEASPRPPRTIDYVVTVAGPEPATLATSPMDHEHYVDKQIRPVAEPVLVLLGEGFDAIAGRGEQLGLF